MGSVVQLSASSFAIFGETANMWEAELEANKARA